MSVLDLSGKVALVTGGSRGIGAATAHLLARAGAKVLVTFHQREAEAQVVVDAIAAGGGQARAVRADLSRDEDCRTSVQTAVDQFGRLDLYVANAGVWPPDDAAVQTMPDSRWHQTLAINLDSVFYGCRAALDVMPDGGRIVIVSSTAGQRGEAYHADYAATKGAIIAFVKSLAIETAPRDITVNSVAPGWVDTEMSAAPYDRDGGKGKDTIAAAIPLGRIATAEDIAGPIVFLCSDLGRHITGEIVNVNGGSVLCG